MKVYVNLIEKNNKRKLLHQIGANPILIKIIWEREGTGIEAYSGLNAPSRDFNFDYKDFYIIFPN